MVLVTENCFTAAFLPARRYAAVTEYQNGDFTTNGGNGQLAEPTTYRRGWTPSPPAFYFFLFNPAIRERTVSISATTPVAGSFKQSETLGVRASVEITALIAQPCNGSGVHRKFRSSSSRNGGVDLGDAYQGLTGALRLTDFTSITWRAAVQPRPAGGPRRPGSGQPGGVDTRLRH